MRYTPLLLLFLASCGGALLEKESSAPKLTSNEPSSTFVLKDPPTSLPAPPELRLPQEATPERYRATLWLDPNKTTFTGVIEIDLEIKAPLKLLWLNATSIEAKSASLWFGAPQKGAIVYETPQKSGGAFFPKIIPGGDNFIGFNFGQELHTGKATLRIAYQGKINKNWTGIFVQEEDKERYLYTQFESTGARRAFPCFDEPSYKVPWQVTITAPSRLAVFSNTAQTKDVFQRDNRIISFFEGDTKTVFFGETKPLPSYLIAFAVGPFEIVDGGKVGKNKVQHRVITLKGEGAWAKEAVALTPEIVARLEEYLGAPYPYDKLDQIAVPTFFGAMENPGLITYARGILLAEPGKESLRQTRSFAQVGAHELAHQWFGDLVTLAWWDELWLNESFAEWMSRRIMFDFRPEWANAESAINSSNSAKRQDRSNEARALRQPIKVHQDIGRSFGNVYSKGQAVLFMLERSLGPEIFKKGVQRYLKENAWKNATAKEFLSAMSAEAGRDVSQEFFSFTDNPGVPVVSASLTCDKATAPKLSLRQNRYKSLTAEEKPATLWRVPVCIRYRAGAEERRECFTLQEASTTQNLTTKACPDWVVLNDSASGYYYSGYSKDLLQKLLKDGGKQLNTVERLALLADLDAQLSSGEMLAGEMLGYLPVLFQDSSYHLTRESSFLVKYLMRLAPSDLSANKERFFKSLYSGRAKGLAFATPKGETDDQKISRSTTLQALMDTYRDDALITEATALTVKALDDKDAVDAELKNTVFLMASRYGDKALFEKFLSFQKEEKRSDKRLILSSLGDFLDPTLMQRALSLTLDKDFPKGAASDILFSVAAIPAHQEALFTFVTQNYEALVASLSTPQTTDYAENLPGLFNGYCDAESKKKVESFFGEKLKGDKDGEESVQNMLKAIDRCITFSTKNQESVKSFLLKY